MGKANVHAKPLAEIIDKIFLDLPAALLNPAACELFTGKMKRIIGQDFSKRADWGATLLRERLSEIREVLLRSILAM